MMSKTATSSDAPTYSPRFFLPLRPDTLAQAIAESYGCSSDGDSLGVPPLDNDEPQFIDDVDDDPPRAASSTPLTLRRGTVSRLTPLLGRKPLPRISVREASVPLYLNHPCVSIQDPSTRRMPSIAPMDTAMRRPSLLSKLSISHTSQPTMSYKRRTAFTVAQLKEEMREQSEAENKEPEDWFSRVKQMCRIVLPHIGMVIITAMYTILGASIFYAIEGPHEKLIREHGRVAIEASREELIETLWHLNQMKVGREEWNVQADIQLDEISLVLYEWYVNTSSQAPNSTTTSIDGQKLNWSFPAAIFFAASTVATIGYGNLAPVTQNGRIFCVFFGLLGVPLMLVTIADFGKFIGDMLCALYLFYTSHKRRLCRLRRSSTSPALSVESESEEHDSIDDLWQVPEQPVKVPVGMILVIIIGYTALGGAILPFWEEWTFWEASYFSFITMSTVGFGDFVPKKEEHYWITLSYILLGLTITTMCVDLVGSQYVVKIHYIGRKFQDLQSRMKTLGEFKAYERLLRRAYGLSEADIQAMHMRGIHSLLYPQAYKPTDLDHIYYIDQRTDTSGMSKTGRDSMTFIRDDEKYGDSCVPSEAL